MTGIVVLTIELILYIVDSLVITKAKLIPYDMLFSQSSPGSFLVSFKNERKISAVNCMLAAFHNINQQVLTNNLDL